MVRDEFTSTIDRNTAMGLCNSVQRYIRDKNLTNVIFAGVHQDVIPFLKPDWIYNTDERTLTINKDKYDMTVKDNKPYFMKIEG
jgi:ABC-type ATPase with predicted acetyltransferase domain